MAEYTIYFKDILKMYGWENILQICKDLKPNTPTYTKQDIANEIQRLYQNYEIAFETIDSFVNEFQRVWNSNINTTCDKLILYNKVNFELDEYIHEYEGQDEGDDRYSDTPNNPMLETDTNFETSIYLTNRSTYKNGKKITDKMKLNPLQKYADISNGVADPLIEFCNKFEKLFNHLIVIKETTLFRRY